MVGRRSGDPEYTRAQAPGRQLDDRPLPGGAGRRATERLDKLQGLDRGTCTLGLVRASHRSARCAFSEPVRPEIIELFLSVLDRSTVDGSPNPGEDSVSQWALIPCRMHLAMSPLLKFVMLLLRCIPAFLPKPEQPGNRRTCLTSAARHLCLEGTQASDYFGRSDILGLPVTDLVGMERESRHRPARHSRPLAPQGFSALLAIHLEAGARTPSNLTRDPGPDSSIRE